MFRWLGLNSWQELGIFLFNTMSRPALGPTRSPIQWVLGALSQGVKQLGHEAGHWPPSSAKVRECAELYLHSQIHLDGVLLSLKNQFFVCIYCCSVARMLTGMYSASRMTSCRLVSCPWPITNLVSVVWCLTVIYQIKLDTSVLYRQLH
jgi:hypothetical protein